MTRMRSAGIAIIGLLSLMIVFVFVAYVQLILLCLALMICLLVMGEEVIIAKAGTPVAKLVPVHAHPKKRMLGSAKGKFSVPDDFNDPLPKEIEDLFYE